MDARAFAGEEPNSPAWSESSGDSRAGGAGRQFRDDIAGVALPPTLLPPPVQRRFGSWNPGASGMCGRSPSACPALASDPSGA
eukprot:10330984-Alexandrium_andersonii.AAC.1